jgi:DNA repair protein RadC
MEVHMDGQDKGFSAIRDWHKDERPRERLLADGEHTLSNAELLCVILGSGSRGKTALDLARSLLTELGGLRNIGSAPPAALKAFKGMGQAKICRLKACLEISRRMLEEKRAVPEKGINSPEDAAKLLGPRLRDLKKEVFKILILDSQNRLLRVLEIEEGTVNYASPIIREVFHKALENFASAVICVHNHPSGNPQPSKEDREFTRALLRAGEALQVEVLDHIIIGEERYYSFADEGLMKREGRPGPGAF